MVTLSKDALFELFGKLCNDSISAEEKERLGALLSDDPEVRRLYVRYLDLHLALLDLDVMDGDADGFSPDGKKILGEEEIASSIQSQTPPYPANQLFGNAFHGAVAYFSQEVPFGFLVATLVLGLLLLGLRLTPVSKGPANLAAASRSGQSTAANGLEPERESKATNKPVVQCVGRITDEVSCIWKNGSKTGRRGDWETRSVVDAITSTNHPSPISNHQSPSLPVSQSPRLVCLGDQLTIASGLLEITFNTDAKVILEGPATFNVEQNGGFLAVGRLTGRMEKRGEGRGTRDEEKTVGRGLWAVGSAKPQAVSSKSLNPKISKSPSLSTTHYPLSTPFVIATPTALVTDLGTEFGVEVDRLGQTEAHVFSGEVVAAMLNQSRKPVKSVHLKAGESTVVALNASDIAVKRIASEKIKSFVRTMPNSLERLGVFFSDDAAKPTLLYGWRDGDWRRDGWCLGGTRRFNVRYGMEYSFLSSIAVANRCWSLGPQASAVRDLGIDLPVGGVFAIEVGFDPTKKGHAMGFALCNAAEQSRFEFAMEDGQDTYCIHDRDGEVKPGRLPSRDTKIAGSPRGLRLALQRIDADTYQLVILRLSDYSKYVCKGRFLKSPAGEDICRLRLWNDNPDESTRSSVSFEPALYFNRIRVLGKLSSGKEIKR